MYNLRDLFKYFYYRLKEQLCISHITRIKGFFKNRKEVNNHKKSIYIITTPEYGNLGDHAIAQAEMNYTREMFPEYIVKEIPDSKFDEYFLCIKFLLNKDDIIFLIGGGNLGMLYPKTEYIRRNIIKICKKNTIVLFPQSYASNDTYFDYLEMKKSISIYSKHHSLYLCIREKKSYNIIKETFKNNTILYLPDIVLSWDVKSVIPSKHTPSQKVLFCIRNDIESNINPDIIDQIKQIFHQRKYKIMYFDTETYRKIPAHSRMGELKNALLHFEEADYVITDRLHGMVLSCIVGTPCLAFDNTTNKVSGVHEWINNKEIVMFDKNIDLYSQIDKLLSYSKFEYDSKYFYKIIDKELKQIVEN